MKARAIELADAVVAHLNSADAQAAFVVKFLAQRRYSPFLEAADRKTLQVFVLTNVRRSEREIRRTTTLFFKPVIMVIQEIEGSDEESKREHTDTLQLLVEQIEYSLLDFEFEIDEDVFSFIAFDEEQDRDSYSLELLRDQGAFGTAITLEYRQLGLE